MMKSVVLLIAAYLGLLAACAMEPTSTSVVSEANSSRVASVGIPTVTPTSIPDRKNNRHEVPDVTESSTQVVAARESTEWITIPSGNVIAGSTGEQVGAAFLACNRAGRDCSETVYWRETPQETIFVDQFEITKFEISNSQYSACVNDGVCNPPHTEGGDKTSPTLLDASIAEFPVIGVSATDASNYCRNWLNGRLPHREQWERAARGEDSRIYPWGDSYIPASANLYSSGLSSVDSHPDGVSPYGVYNMIGNVWEWTDQDVRAAGNMPPSIVVRGGGWTSEPYEARIAYLGESLNSSSFRNDIGMRCVREYADGTSTVFQTRPIEIVFGLDSNELHWLVSNSKSAQITCYTILGRSITASWDIEIGAEGAAPFPDNSVTCILSAEGYDGSIETAVVALSQPNNECDTDPDPAFASIYEEYASSLDCTTGPAVTVPLLAEQSFQGGYMIWRSDTDAVYVVYTPTGQSQSDPDWSWDGSNPDGTGMMPPDGLFEPVRGFGWLWRTHLGAEQSELGWATNVEQGVENVGLIQEFTGGLLVKASDPKVYVLLYEDRRP